MEGLVNSFIIGALVVALSVPLGLAGAIVMTQIYSPARSLYYLDRRLAGADAGRHHRHFDGDFLEGRDRAHRRAIPVQRHFPRHARSGDFHLGLLHADFPRRACNATTGVQEEAALDLGASRTQVFFDILLPFLRPAIFSAAVIAFLVVVRKLQHHHFRHPRRQDADDGAGRPRARRHDAGDQRDGGGHHRRDGGSARSFTRSSSGLNCAARRRGRRRESCRHCEASAATKQSRRG